MNLHILKTPDLLGREVAAKTATLLNEAIASKGSARLILSTGASQFETLHHLRNSDVDWSKVEMFHLDEYIGVDSSHPASFVKYLKERFIMDMQLKKAHLIDGTADISQVIADVTTELRKAPIDVALIGIGENSHIAFNDPPADFDTKEAYITVALDDDCKKQQIREGWFATMDDVPKLAITMSPWQIMQSKIIISAVPHSVKAKAVKATLESELTNKIPATMLKTHSDWTLYLDDASASLLKENKND